MFKTPFYSKTSVAVSEHPLSSKIGVEVLENSGNAVDAAIATSFALAVTQPHLGGIGGDYFALIRDPDGHVYFIDGSGYSPSKLTREYVLSLGYRSMPSHGALSINVPGMIDALHSLWKRFGSIEWSRLVEKSIALARNGFYVYGGLASSLEKLYDELVRDQGSRITYYSRGVPSEGFLIKFPNLARALELIADDPRCFYEGEIAESIIEYVESRGGVLELSDLKSYSASWSNPLKITYRDRVVYEMPPPTQGVTTLHFLLLLEEHSVAEIDPRSFERVKLFLDIAEIAYGLRELFVTDPRYMDVKAEDMLSRELIEKHRGKARSLWSGGGDTTFYAIADRDGWVIASIQSLFHPFGSRITEPRYGVTLNSRASSFSLDERHVNRLEPRKKTMHTLSAIILEDSERVYAIGLSGGHYRPLLHAQLVTNIVDYGMHVQEAIEHPRFVWEIGRNEVVYEKGYVNDSLRGYRVIEKPYPSRLGVAAVVEVHPGFRGGYADIRGDGLPLGSL